MKYYKINKYLPRCVRIVCKCLRENVEKQVCQIGEVIYGNIDTLYIDNDGDSYMECYDSFGTYLGNLCMNRFQSVD